MLLGSLLPAFCVISLAQKSIHTDIIYKRKFLGDVVRYNFGAMVGLPTRLPQLCGEKLEMWSRRSVCALNVMSRERGI